ncbi:MAG TPA: hypothetical protein VGJ33_14490 [Candidatus Angelobacter sp.]|jgi:hypothetical protein
MPITGKYCKAYPLSKMELWPQWKNKVRMGVTVEETPDGSTKVPYVFLQENFTVTKSVFLDQEVLFDETTPEWKKFCENVLDFHPAGPSQA